MSCAQNVETNSHLSPLTTHHSGITLIALVITIVIMLILAGITLNLTLGENGIFQKARLAKSEYEIASIQEEIKMKLLETEIKLSQNGNTMSNVQIAMVLSKYGEVTVDANQLVTKVTTAAGDVNIGDVWAGEQEARGNLGKVIFTKDTGGNIVPVPTGFYYVGGTVDTGVVISDALGDEYQGTDKTAYEYNTTLTGNQFVWVPVAGGIENARSDFGTDKNYYGNFADCIDILDDGYGTVYKAHTGVAENQSSDEATEAAQIEIDVENYDAMKTSVNNYGGFYVARYEASTSDFAGNSGKTSGATAGNVLSKANGKPWDAINQAEAKAKCEAMYNDSSSVKSLLMSSYTWDATLSFIQNKGDKKNVSKDSTTWGNYFNRRGVKDKITFTGNYINATWTWDAIGTFKGTWTNGTDVSSAEMSNYLKLGTGTSESTKANNIYDIAGNMWEWTTEISNIAGSNANNRVLRGGGGSYNDSDDPASSRGGHHSVTSTDVGIGFRPQLFIQM